MKLANLTAITRDLNEEEIEALKKEINSSRTLADALMKVLQPKINNIERELSDVEKLASIPNCTAYVLSLLQERKVYSSVIDLLS